MCCLKEMHFHYKDTNWIKVKRWKQIYQNNTHQKKNATRAKR